MQTELLVWHMGEEECESSMPGWPSYFKNVKEHVEHVYVYDTVVHLLATGCEQTTNVIKLLYKNHVLLWTAEIYIKT